MPKGLSIPLDQFSTLQSEGPFKIKNDSDIKLMQFELDISYNLAVCSLAEISPRVNVMDSVWALSM